MLNGLLHHLRHLTLWICTSTYTSRICTSHRSLCCSCCLAEHQLLLDLALPLNIFRHFNLERSSFGISAEFCFALQHSRCLVRLLGTGLAGPSRPTVLSFSIPISCRSARQSGRCVWIPTLEEVVNTMSTFDRAHFMSI